MENFQIKGAPTCRVVYVDGLFEKRAVKGTEAEPKYNATILVPKSDVDKIAQVDAEYAKAFAELQTKGCKLKNPSGLNPKNNCYVDGDTYADNTGREDFRGYMMLKVASKNYRPIVTDTQKRIILNGVPMANVNVENISDETLGSGDYIFANVSFWTYCNPTVQGVGCNIHALVRAKEGERIGGASMNVDDYIELQGYE